MPIQKTTNQVVKHQIKEICEARNISPYRLSVMTGLGSGLIYRLWDSPEDLPSLPTLVLIARALQLHESELYVKNLTTAE